MIKCPICGQYDFEEIDDFDACDICHWQNDDLQMKDSNYWGGANDLNLNNYKAEWKKSRGTHCPAHLTKKSTYPHL
jgi:hypothetical protein